MKCQNMIIRLGTCLVNVRLFPYVLLIALHHLFIYFIGLLHKNKPNSHGMEWKYSFKRLFMALFP